MDDEATSVRRKRQASINGHGPGQIRRSAGGLFSRQLRGCDGCRIFRLGRLKGIERPAIGALFPTKDVGQQVLVLDVGANTDCKPSYLHQFALLGNIYARDVLGVKQPRWAAEHRRRGVQRQ